MSSPVRTKTILSWLAERGQGIEWTSGFHLVAAPVLCNAVSSLKEELDRLAFEIASGADGLLDDDCNTQKRLLREGVRNASFALAIEALSITREMDLQLEAEDD